MEHNGARSNAGNGSGTALVGWPIFFLFSTLFKHEICLLFIRMIYIYLNISSAGFFPTNQLRADSVTSRYLAPLVVHERFRGRGIGRRLLDWAIEQADAASPPTAIYLEAAPNARPIYLHLGFQALVGEGKEDVLVRRVPPTQATK